uniref:Protein Wnt n=1 Tax=Haemonchus placei TaxID=6290 RepID=A0A0N4X4C8_HAEPC
LQGNQYARQASKAWRSSKLANIFNDKQARSVHSFCVQHEWDLGRCRTSTDPNFSMAPSMLHLAIVVQLIPFVL